MYSLGLVGRGERLVGDGQQVAVTSKMPRGKTEIVNVSEVCKQQLRSLISVMLRLRYGRMGNILKAYRNVNLVLMMDQTRCVFDK